MLLRHRRGNDVAIAGLGMREALALDAWRRDREAKARANMPTSLSWAREAAIHGRYEAERLRLVAEEQKHRARAERRRAIVRAKWAATRQSIEADISATRGLASDLRAGLDPRLRAAHQAQAEAAHRLDAARRHLRNAAS